MAGVSGGGAVRLAWGKEAQGAAAPGATTGRAGYTALIPGKGQVRWSPAHTVLAKRGPGRPASLHFLLICTEGLFWPVDPEAESKAGGKRGLGSRQGLPFLRALLHPHLCLSVPEGSRPSAQCWPGVCGLPRKPEVVFWCQASVPLLILSPPGGELWVAGVCGLFRLGQTLMHVC